MSEFLLSFALALRYLGEIIKMFWPVCLCTFIGFLANYILFRVTPKDSEKYIFAKKRLLWSAMLLFVPFAASLFNIVLWVICFFVLTLAALIIMSKYNSRYEAFVGSTGVLAIAWIVCMVGKAFLSM